MNKDSLIVELEKCGLDTSGSKEEMAERMWTHISLNPEPIVEQQSLHAALWTAEYLQNQSKNWLRSACIERGLRKSGNKKDFVDRLLAYENSGNDIRDTLQDMEQLVEETGKRMIMKKKLIFELAGEDVTTEPSLTETLEEKASSDAADIVAFVKAVGKTKVKRMKRIELRQQCSMYFPDIDLNKLKKSEIIALIMKTYREQAFPENAGTFTEPDMESETEPSTSSPLETDSQEIEEKDDAIREPVFEEERDMSVEESWKAQMMMLDQIKSGPGLFKGDIDQAIDNIISEMRTIYGAYIPVQLDDPMDFFNEDDQTDVDVHQEVSTEFGLDEKDGDQDMNIDSDEKDIDVDTAGKDMYLVDASNEMPTEESKDAEEEVEKIEDWSPSPMGGPDMDEQDIVDEATEVSNDAQITEQSDIDNQMSSSEQQVDEELGIAEEEAVDVPNSLSDDEAAKVIAVDDQETEIVIGKRRSRDERHPELPKADPEVLRQILAASSADVRQTVSIPEETPEDDDLVEEADDVIEEEWEMAEEAPQSVSMFATQLFKSYAREELLEMSDENFLNLVQPLNMDIGPFREAFIDRLTSLTFSDTDEAARDTELIELSLSEMTQTETTDNDVLTANIPDDINIPDTGVDEETLIFPSSAKTVDEDKLEEHEQEEIENQEEKDEELTNVFDASPEEPLRGSTMEEEIERSYTNSMTKSDSWDVPLSNGYMDDVTATSDQPETMPSSTESNTDIKNADNSSLTPFPEISTDTSESGDGDDDQEFSERTVDVTSTESLVNGDVPATDNTVDVTPEMVSSEVGNLKSVSQEDIDMLSSYGVDESDAAICNIERVLRDLQKQRLEWEISAHNIADVLDTEEEITENQKRKEDLRKEIETLNDKYEEAKQDVYGKEKEIVHLRNEINRVICEYDLLPVVPLIGDGNGDYGLFATYDVDPQSTDLTSFRFSFDEDTRDYMIDEPISEKTFSPSDRSIVDQYNNNLTSASETEVLMRSVSEPKKKKQHEDVFKNPSSIAVGMVIGVTELCKRVFPNLFGSKE